MKPFSDEQIEAIDKMQWFMSEQEQRKFIARIIRIGEERCPEYKEHRKKVLASRSQSRRRRSTRSPAKTRT
jgi:hypothetical protein